MPTGAHDPRMGTNERRLDVLEKRARDAVSQAAERDAKCLLASASACSQEKKDTLFNHLEGKWVVSGGPNSGEQVRFNKDSSDASFPWWGPTAVSSGIGMLDNSGDRVTITGNGVLCFYHINLLGDRKMVWERVKMGEFGRCPPSFVLEKDSSP
jgi:hypothetical protein